MNARPSRPTVEPIAVGMRDLPRLTGLSERSINRLRTRGRFPAPDRTIGRRNLWLVSTVRAWLGEVRP